ncbi:hypothetical protein FNT36_13870 [Hymenobacter setariae]|uniref:Uncharacterized protein n=1 Tax=Hymenobacter setariae TaxID=2594794 RepID=A0A558BVK3_9BACT|nr:hypothetical protein [Hymenobacter setariae]TVT40558.1 hypothetical protein FNT36_13870 [Hymenobacter setariae]
MTRYLSEAQLTARLNLGKAVGQFLSRQDLTDYAVIKWLTIYKGGEEKEYSLYYNEVIDEGPENFLDLVELTPVDPDDYPVIEEFNSVEEVLVFAARKYGTSLHKYVTDSMVNDEYADYLRGIGIIGK